MPINKSLFKKEISFVGMTEYLGSINKKRTLMMMHGEKFQLFLILHINVRNIYKSIKANKINNFIKEILKNLRKPIYNFKFSNINFLCFNPHWGKKAQSVKRI